MCHVLHGAKSYIHHGNDTKRPKYVYNTNIISIMDGAPSLMLVVGALHGILFKSPSNRFRIG